jgi:peptide/nickel transport system permease protein
MAEVSKSLDIPETTAPPEEQKKAGTSTLNRVMRYTVVRLLTLAITVVIAMYLTVLIANMGGYVDEIRMGEIRQQVSMSFAANPAYRTLSQDQRTKLINDQIAVLAHHAGLDKPFLIRSFTFLKDGLTLNLGRALFMTSNSGSTSVRDILLERLPATLVLFGISDILLFLIALVLALMLSRAYGSIFDKMSVALTPFSSAPGWFYGIFLILLFASIFPILPFGGMVAAPPPDNKFAYLLSLGQHLILPVAALTLSQIFLSIFTWRTFFLIYSSEDYVDMAKAKGLPDRDINNKYILRPTLPTIITSFALLVIGSWLGAPIFETIFSWPGLGRALFQAIGFFDTPVIVGETVIFAYLLAITVFLLDIVYALVDPRVKIGGEGSQQ